MIILRSKQFSFRDRINYIRNDYNVPLKTGAGMSLGALAGIASGKLKYAGASILGGGIIGGIKGIYDSNKDYNENLKWSKLKEEKSKNANILNPIQKDLKNNPPKEYSKLIDIISSNQYKREVEKIDDIFSNYDTDYPYIAVRDIDGNTEINDNKVILISIGSCFYYDIEYNIKTKTWSELGSRNTINLKSFIIDTLKNLGSERNISDLDDDEKIRIKKFNEFLIQQIKQKL